MFIDHPFALWAYCCFCVSAILPHALPGLHIPVDGHWQHDVQIIADHIKQVIDVHKKQERTENASLRDPSLNRFALGIDYIDHDSLGTASEIALEPKK